MVPKTPRTPKTPKTPPSRLNANVEWKQCAACNVTYWARDKHKAACPLIASEQYTAEEQHGFILNHQLYGRIEEHCDKCLSFEMEVKRSSLIFLSPAAMQLCGIQVGSFVSFETFGPKSGTCIFIALPCPHQNPSAVSLSLEITRALPFDLKALVKVSAIKEQSTVAKTVHLSVEGDCSVMNTNQLATAFLHQFDRYIIKEGILCYTKNYGQKWLVKIDKIETSSNSTKEVTSEALESEFKAITLEETPKYSLLLQTTKVVFPQADEPKMLEKDSLSDFGGNHEVINDIVKMCTSVFNTSKRKTSVPRGILLYGPPGTGKSFLVRAIANHFKVPLFTILGPELFSKYYGETESKIRGRFDEALKSEPCILLMDEIDTLCPRRDSTSTHSDQEKRVVATLLTMMDSIPKHSRIFIMAATNRPDALDPALRRPGRLDRELEMRAPTVAERREILEAFLKKTPHVLEEKHVEHLAAVTHGYVGADLSLLCAEAALAAAKRTISTSEEDADDETIAKRVSITPEDAKQALHLVKPSAMREVLVEVPNVRWSDIGGQEELKLKLKQAVEWPLRYPEAFQRLGVEPPRGLLMFGPPGCSKTMIAKALATESGLNFIAVKGPELFSKWVGESERAVREVFRRARQVAPAIVFLDELDALGSARGGGSSSANVGDRVLAQLLTEMDGIEALKDVTVVAATNRPDMIDKALLRPGRLDRIVYVALPDEKTRREILQLKFRSMPVDSGVSLEWLVRRTEGYSGAEVTAVCNEAALRALEEDVNTERIHRNHFEFALSVVAPRITAETIAFYENYVRESGIRAV